MYNMKIFVFLCLSLSLTFGLHAQENNDGVMMKNGNLIVIKGGKMNKMIKDIGFINGSRITITGTIIQKDGSKIALKEGEYINPAGKKTKNMYLDANDQLINDTLK